MSKTGLLKVGLSRCVCCCVLMSGLSCCVFANKNFDTHEIIEITPHIHDDNHNFKGIIRDYVFKKDDNKSVVAFGYLSLCNHSDIPNTTWDMNDTNIIIKATHKINKDDEIFISYGEGYWKNRNNKIAN